MPTDGGRKYRSAIEAGVGVGVAVAAAASETSMALSEYDPQ
jgi:hypothetical protein